MFLQKRCQLASENQLRQSLIIAFNNVDVDKSEFLSKIQFEEVMRRLTFIMGADDCTEEEINFLIEKLDENGDGTVSRTEFQRLINIVAKLAFPETHVKPIVKKKRATA